MSCQFWIFLQAQKHPPPAIGMEEPLPIANKLNIASSFSLFYS